MINEINEKDIKNIKILIASNSKYFINMIKQTLNSGGFKHIFEAETFKQLSSCLINNIPDILIISWNFKPMNGIDACKFLRSSPKSPARYLPIIMANEFSDKKQIKIAVDAGINELLVIPFSTKNVLNKIQNILKNPRNFIEVSNYFGPDRRRKNDPNYKGIERRKKNKSLTPEQIASLLKKE